MRRSSMNQVERRTRALPAWLLSMSIHAALVVSLVAWLHDDPVGARDEPGRTTGIVLKHVHDDSVTFQGEEQTEQDRIDEPTDSTSRVVAALPDEPTGVQLPEALPSRPELAGPAVTPSRGVPNAANLTRGGGGQPRSLPGGKARVSVFGVVGEGTKFVYVFDRSDSMARERRLATAKSELLGSLDSLESTHQFQILFFNHQLQVFDISGGQKRIPFATDRSKHLAAKFAGSITPYGGTDRLNALIHAVNMRPDVIFFLTDSDDPMLAGDMDRIRKRNRSVASINTIEFGFGPSVREENFLVRLARQNGGQYVYVDTSTFAARRP